MALMGVSGRTGERLVMTEFQFTDEAAEIKRVRATIIVDTMDRASNRMLTEFPFTDVAVQCIWKEVHPIISPLVFPGIIVMEMNLDL